MFRQWIVGASAGSDLGTDSNKPRRRWCGLYLVCLVSAASFLTVPDAICAQSPPEEDGGPELRVAYVGESKKQFTGELGAYETWKPLKGARWYEIAVQMWCSDVLPMKDERHGKIYRWKVPSDAFRLFTERSGKTDGYGPVGELNDNGVRESPRDVTFRCEPDDINQWTGWMGGGIIEFDIPKDSGKPVGLRIGTSHFDLTNKAVKKGNAMKLRKNLHKLRSR